MKTKLVLDILNYLYFLITSFLCYYFFIFYRKIYLFLRATPKIIWTYNWILAATESYFLVYAYSQSCGWNAGRKDRMRVSFYSRFLFMIIAMGSVWTWVIFRVHKWVGDLSQMSKSTSFAFTAPMTYHIRILLHLLKPSVYRSVFPTKSLCEHPEKRDWVPFIFNFSTSITTSKHWNENKLLGK